VAHVTHVGRSPAPLVAAGAAPSRGARPPALTRSAALAAVRRFGASLAHEWLPQLGWAVGRTGRAGLVGLALLAASALFVATTHVQVADQVRSLTADLAAARARATAPQPVAAGPITALDGLPARAEMPAVLGTLLQQADTAHLTLDTGKYELSTAKSGRITRYKLSFPVTGPYPQVRQFIDATLAAMPAVAISDLSFERKTIGDPVVEAQIRMTVFVRSTP
jgi:hypothetical protein